MSHGIGCRRGLDPAWLWLWHRPEATALIVPLAWEPPYATGAALERERKKERDRERERERQRQRKEFPSWLSG